jgi:hypothetical protein
MASNLLLLGSVTVVYPDSLWNPLEPGTQEPEPKITPEHQMEAQREAF